MISYPTINPPITAATLGEALRTETALVRQHLPIIDSWGPMFRNSATLMRLDLDQALKALAEGDVIEMIRVHERLKGWTK